MMFVWPNAPCNSGDVNCFLLLLICLWAEILWLAKGESVLFCCIQTLLVCSMFVLEWGNNAPLEEGQNLVWKM